MWIVRTKVSHSQELVCSLSCHHGETTDTKPAEGGTAAPYWRDLTDITVTTARDGNSMWNVMRFKIHHAEVDTCTSNDNYRPQAKLREGNVFTSVCQSFCSQGAGVYAVISCLTETPWTETPLDRDSPDRAPRTETPNTQIPRTETPRMVKSGRYASY